MDVEKIAETGFRIDPWHITAGLSTVCLTLVLAYFIKIWNAYRFFKKKGIKTPPHSFFFGHKQQIIERKAYSSMLHEWTQKYGKFYGIYEGHLPMLVTSDIGTIQEVFIKQFTNFSPRVKPHLVPHEDDSILINLIVAAGSRWKRMRNIMNPTFSTAKLRDVTPLLVECTDRLIKVLDTKKDKECNVSETLKRYSLDAIWNCAFGVDIDVQQSVKGIEYFHRCEKFFQNQEDINFFSFIGVYMHEFKSFITYILIYISKLSMLLNIKGNVRPYPWLMENVKNIVSTRKEENMRRKDYLQLLLDAEDSNVDIHTKFIDHSKFTFEKKLTTSELEQNLILFMVAGYETTSTSLSVCFHILATHPHEQQKLVDEIHSLLENVPESEVNGDNVSKLPYLDMFFKEILRMYPVVDSIVGRRSVIDTNLNGIDIPKDLTILADVMSVHYDPEIWGPMDTHEFIPERHSPEYKRHPAAFMGFGLGPRNCIGMKFAILEVKIALVRILMNFEILAGPNTPKQLDFVEGVVRKPKDGVSVIIKKRQQHVDH